MSLNYALRRTRKSYLYTADGLIQVSSKIAIAIKLISDFYEFNFQDLTMERNPSVISSKQLTIADTYNLRFFLTFLLLLLSL